MDSTRLLELLQIFGCYTFLVFGLAELMIKPFTRGKGAAYRICADLVVGNFYIINLMFLLAYLKCLYQPLMIVVFLGGACMIRYLIDKNRVTAYFRLKYDRLCKIERGEYGARLVRQKLLQKSADGIKQLFAGLSGGSLLEGLLLLLTLGIFSYYFSYQALHFVSYAAPDVEVHLYWIQSLVGGELFPAGVYPFGMHCVGAAISLLYGISAVTVGRMLGVVTAFYLMLLMYLLVKSLCSLRYAPILGLFLTAVANITVDTTYMRYSAMISQEYAMLFLVPLMFFLYRYLNEKKQQELVLFGMAFSLTIAVHFYLTAIACFFFLAIGMVYLYRMIKRKQLLPILLCGVLSTAAAVLPLAVGLGMGYELEQSFIYGASVILNDSEMYTSAGAAEMEDKKEEKKAEEQAGKEMEKNKLSFVLQESAEQLEAFVFQKVQYFWICVIAFGLVLADWLRRLVRGMVTDRSLEYLSQMLYLLLLIAELLFEKFDLPVLIEPKRIGIFIAYLLPFLFAVPFELLYRLFECRTSCKALCVSEEGVQAYVKGSPYKQRFWKGFCNLAVLACLGGACFFISKSGNIKKLPTVYYFQTTGAMKAACDIIKHYEKESWTIVSSVNETTLTYNSGYHYELLDFIMELEDYQEGMELVIPTEYIFFYIEKMPIQRYGYSFSVEDELLSVRDCINKEAALAEIKEEYSKRDEYYKQKRLELMSRMYYWAKQYQSYFPDEMTVFYEDDEILIYRLKQNTYALNNLAMDYRKELLDE